MDTPFLAQPGPQPEFTTAHVQLPTFHRAQAKLRWLMSRARYVVARCGRRWGKNALAEPVAVDDAAHGRLVGWFAPENRRAAESYNAIHDMLEPIKKNSSKTDHVIRTINGGRIDFWSLEDENAGRGRKYHRIIIDEAAFTKNKQALKTLQESILPTLLDFGGRALVMSNTNGIDPENLLYALCHEPKYRFVCFHAPTHTNPHLPKDDVAQLIHDYPALVYQQEFLAEFVDWSGAAFFTRQSLLVNGEPVPLPGRCEAVFSILDTATKTGKEHDGTGLIYFALVKLAVRPVSAAGVIGPSHMLVILDWEIQQIEGALLETWLPQVFERGQELATVCKARAGFVGAFIEDKASGMVLLQQAARRGWPAHAIESKLTSLGKDERAISVSGYIHRGLVKISRPAYEKVTLYKGSSRNHLLGEVVGFRVGDKSAGRSDDLL